MLFSCSVELIRIASGLLLISEISRIWRLHKNLSATAMRNSIRKVTTPLFLFPSSFLLPPPVPCSLHLPLAPSFCPFALRCRSLRYALVARPTFISHPSTSHFRRKHVRNGRSFSLSFWRYGGGYTCILFCDRWWPPVHPRL